MKFKSNIFVLSLLAILYACEESPIVVYEQPNDAVYFFEKKIDRFVEYNFATTNQKKSVLGDSLQIDTISVVMMVLGRNSEKDRKVFFKTKPIENLDDSGLNLVEYPQPFIFRSNQYKDTVKFIFHRPAKRQTVYGISIEIDHAHPESDFVAGPKEHMACNIKLSDKFTKPYSWRNFESWYGEYSVEKHAFMLTVLRDKHFWVNWRKGAQNIKLRAALNNYNEAHPDNPKDFTFPVKESNW